MKKYAGINGRKQLINDIVNEYIDKTAKKIIFINGDHGQGKSYVLDSITNRVSQLTFISILKNLDNDLVYKIGDKPLKKQKINSASISFGNQFFSFGISTGWDNQSYYDKIRNSLSQFLSNDLLICVDDISDASDSLRCFITNIIKCSKELENEFKKNIYFLISDSSINYSDFFKKYEFSNKIIELPKYTYDDIKSYFFNYKCISNINDNNLTHIYDLSRGNLSIADFLYEETIQEGKDFIVTLKDVIYRRLSCIKEQGKLNDISEKNMENIIFSASLALKKFSAEFINNIIKQNINHVKDGLEIAKNEDLIDKDIKKYYFFISKDIQKYLANLSCKKHENLLISYYNYYTLNEIDNYFSRAYYILKYQGEMTIFTFSLLIMAYSFARKIEDDLKAKEIESLFKKENTHQDFRNNFKLIKDYYNKLLNNNSFDEISKIYYAIRNKHWELVIKALLTLEYFHYLYRNTKMDEPKNIRVLNNCINYAMNTLKLNIPHIDGLIEVNETCLQLNIIYEIAPCVLDQMNNYEQFILLYNKSKELTHSNTNFKHNGLGEYIENVFNRKAFLFANQTACDYYYEKAKSYFYNNEIWIEYYITLICQAGTNIVIQAYEDALENCEKVKIECKEKNIILPQIEKLYNNEIIAEFLLFEKNSSTEKKAILSAKKALTKLKKLINNDKNATQFVIYTNICSLSLYCGNEKQYMKYKKELEKKYGCSDISNINDQSIDDFYRYYFSWFEIYRMMIHEDWRTMESYAKSISGFIPSLFKKQEIFWDKKNEAVMHIVKQKNKISAYEFCHNLVKTNRQEQILSKFFYRGLMVSDLQYTSYF